ncbi:MAG TPA: Tad domain-containing protein [Pyrinomonadaceae bacterium]|nr:Tad domain-containing protein [Pyrinomonadaceae bacterium]
MNRHEPNRSGKGERGSVLTLSAIAMLGVLLAVGLGVDISHFYLAKTELQNAADAAALAAASAINSNPSGIAEGTRRAIQSMNKYEFNKDNVQFTSDNVVWAANIDGPYLSVAAASAAGIAPTIRFVKVTSEESPVSISFASVVLGSNKNMSATSTAGLSIPLNSFCGFIPLSVLIDDDLTKLVPGTVYTIRAGSGSTVSPGDYQILAVAGPGGVDVGFGIGAGVDACAKPGDTYVTDCKPGLTAGKVRTGINSRFDDYGGSQLDPALEPPDTNIKENITWDQYNANFGCGRPGMPACDSRYVTAPSHPGVDMRRVVLIPLVKVSEFDPGRCEVKFSRFGAFFMRTKASNGSGGDIQAEYIEDRIAIGKGTYDPNGGVGDPLLAVPVLYR